MSKYVHFAILTSAFLLCACAKASNNKSINTPITSDTSFYAKGADIGWLSQMENEGKKFYDAAGKQMDCIALLKSKGINSIRLRVWVNPTTIYCGTSDVIAQAKRAQNSGMKIMIDFHYSDWWADPGKQNKPAAWQNLKFDAGSQDSQGLEEEGKVSG